MKPQFFGSSQRPLFGLHTPPAGTPRSSAVVICAPHGQEYIRSHRTLRELGGRLAQAGFHVLRFDYYGCGDSGGSASEGDLEQWASDVATAINEAKDESGLEQASLVGLRLGAALAARASLGRNDLDRLVLWEPVVEGRAHVRELTERHRQRERGWRPSGDPGPLVEILGFPWSPALRASVESIDPASLCPERPGARRVLVVTGATADDAAALRDRLEALGADPDGLRVESAPFWHKDHGVGQAVVPRATLQRIVEWLAAAA